MKMKDKILDWLLQRARERSTWLGIISLLTALGITMTPAQTEAVVTAAMAVAGAILALSRDK